MALAESEQVVHAARQESAASPATHWIARQPILNLELDVVGYELLFRNGVQNGFDGDPDDATRRVLVNCLAMDIESLANGGLAFVNCTREALVGKLVTLLPPATTVLEVLETIEPDAEVVKACRELHELGYLLALDDFVPREEMRPLIELADYIKVDFRLSDSAERVVIRRMLAGSDAILLAEKLEDHTDFDIACKEGYQLFQGYFFCRPTIIAGRQIPPNRMNYLLLLAELTRPDLNVQEVARIVRLETSLLYRLLRLANSPAWGLRGTVTSVREALMLVGEDRFRLLVSVAASTVLGNGQPSALMTLSLERARFCELLAPLIGENPTEQFMLGLLSLLDAMIETQMAVIVQSMPLREAAKEALLGAVNRTSLALRMIQRFESGSSAGEPGGSEAPEIDEQTFYRLYVEAVRWAADSIAAIA